MRPLTERQEEALAAIRSSISRRGIPPSRSELARELGLKTSASVAGHLSALAAKGYIELLPETQRGIRLLITDTVPILTTVYRCPHSVPLVTPERIAATLPDLVASAFDPYPHFFMVLGNNAPRMSGLNPSVIIAVHKDAAVEDFDFHVVRLRGNILCRHVLRVGGGELDLSYQDEHGTLRHERVDERAEDFETEGAVVGLLAGASASEFAKVSEDLRGAVHPNDDSS